MLPLLHLFTPIDEQTTHYFFALARTAFEQEDEPMIAACQAQMGTTDLCSLKPVLLSTDVGTMKARRRLDALIQQERP